MAKSARDRTKKTRQQEALRELRDLPLWSGVKLEVKKTQRVDELFESSDSEDDMPQRRTRKAATKKSAPARSHNANACSKNQRIDNMYRVTKKIAPSKPVYRRPATSFDELASLRIEQKGFCEWQHSLLQGHVEYQYHAAVIVPAAPPRQAMSMLALPGELRNRIFDLLLKEEQEVTVKQYSAQSAAKGSRRSARKVSEKPRFQSYALAQTCKQLRSEYLTLLRKKRRVRVDLLDLYDYLDTFHPAENQFDPHERAEGHIEPVWHEIELRERFDVLQLAKIANASPELHFYLEASENEVRLPEYHELATIKTIIETYSQWEEISNTIRIRSIWLSSSEDDSWYRYNRNVEIQCQRAIAGRADKRDSMINAWIFKSGLGDREDVTLACKTSYGTHRWEPKRTGDVAKWAYKWWPHGDEYGNQRTYTIEADSESDLGYKKRG
jgi:hypothetical protein